LTWDEYWKQLEDARQEISELELIPLDQARDRLEVIALQWEAITTVELPNETQIAVDHTFLVSLLRSSTPDLARIDHLLAVLLAERDSLVDGQYTAADLESLKSILALPEFKWKEQNTGQPGALEKLWQRIQQELGKLARTLFSFDGSTFIFGSGAVLLLIAMLLFLLRNVLFGFVAEARLTPHTRTCDEVLTADAALKRAQDLSRGGDNRSAVRYLYLSALLLLEERGLLGYDRTKTNREYLFSVRDQPELEIPLRHVVEVFDRVWYGYQPLDDQGYEFYERQVGKLRQQRQIIQPKNEGGSSGL
jgi:glutathione S-transferase